MFVAASDILIVTAAAAAGLSGIYLERWRSGLRVGRPGRGAIARVVAMPRVVRPHTDESAQLRAVMAADYQARPLLSAAELRVLQAAEAAILELRLSWRVMAQVSLGEVLRSPDPAAFWAINAKRVDILLVTRSGQPIAAIEYQGGGHYQGSAAARDAVKREALRKAGIGYVEITPHDSAADIAREIARLATRARDPAKRPPCPA